MGRIEADVWQESSRFGVLQVNFAVVRWERAISLLGTNARRRWNWDRMLGRCTQFHRLAPFHLGRRVEQSAEQGLGRYNGR
jgi:hypothetical protein